MPTYVSLVNFTELGIKNVKDTVKRSEAFKTLAKKHGSTVKEIFWVHGRYDAVSIIESPDDASATALAMSISRPATSARRPCAPSRRRKWRRSWRKSSRAQRLRSAERRHRERGRSDPGNEGFAMTAPRPAPANAIPGERR